MCFIFRALQVLLLIGGVTLGYVFIQTSIAELPANFWYLIISVVAALVVISVFKSLMCCNKRSGYYGGSGRGSHSHVFFGGDGGGCDGGAGGCDGG